MCSRHPLMRSGPPGPTAARPIRRRDRQTAGGLGGIASWSRIGRARVVPQLRRPVAPPAWWLVPACGRWDGWSADAPSPKAEALIREGRSVPAERPSTVAGRVARLGQSSCLVGFGCLSTHSSGAVVTGEGQAVTPSSTAIMDSVFGGLAGSGWGNQEGAGCPTTASERRAFRLAGSSASSGRRTARYAALAVAGWVCGVPGAADGALPASRQPGAAPASSAA